MPEESVPIDRATWWMFAGCGLWLVDLIPCILSFTAYRNGNHHTIVIWLAFLLVAAGLALIVLGAHMDTRPYADANQPNPKPTTSRSEDQGVQQNGLQQPIPEVD